MKYLKYFEEKSEPEVGDYVICQDLSKLSKHNQFYYKKTEFENYLNTNVGKIIKKSIDLYKVAFDNDPQSLDILEYAFIQKNDPVIRYLIEDPNYSSDIKIFNGKYSNIVGFDIHEIVDFSSDKIELEAKLNSNKYNL